MITSTAPNPVQICEDLWNKITFSITETKKSGELTRTQWINAFTALSFDATDALFDDITGYDIITKHNWILYWQKSLQTEYWGKLKQLHSLLLQNIDRDNIKSVGSNALCCYQWRLPKLQLLEMELLCAGYIRQNHDIFVPRDIIKICVYYACYNIVDEVKHSESNDSFESGIFVYKSFKFYVTLWVRPHYDFTGGHLKETCRSFDFTIYWLDGPTDIDGLDLTLSVVFMEKYMVLLSNEFCRFIQKKM